MEGSIGSVFWCFKDPHAGLELSAAKSGREGGQRDSATMSMERKFRSEVKKCFFIEMFVG